MGTRATTGAARTDAREMPSRSVVRDATRRIRCPTDVRGPFSRSLHEVSSAETRAAASWWYPVLSQRLPPTRVAHHRCVTRWTRPSVAQRIAALAPTPTTPPTSVPIQKRFARHHDLCGGGTRRKWSVVTRATCEVTSADADALSRRIMVSLATSASRWAGFTAYAERPARNQRLSNTRNVAVLSSTASISKRAASRGIRGKTGMSGAGARSAR